MSYMSNMGTLSIDTENSTTKLRVLKIVFAGKLQFLQKTCEQERKRRNSSHVQIIIL